MDDDNKLIDLIYKAALDTESWYPLLDLLGEKLNEKMQHSSDSSLQQQTFSTLIAHFQNAIRLSEKDLQLQNERESLTSTLNQLPIAVLIVKQDGTIIRQNECAKSLFHAQNILEVDSLDRIGVCNQPEQTKLLREKILHIATSADQKTQTQRLPTLHTTIALAPATALSESIRHNEHLVSVFIASVSIKNEISQNWIQCHYDVIPSEAKLIHALVTSANTLNEAAEELQISKETARSYLKNIFSVLDVHSQVELVKKVKADAPMGMTQEQAKFDAPKRDFHSITLNDGRAFAYSEFGAHDGYPVFVFHTFSGSRILVHPDHSIAKRLKVRLISADRPGFGRSDPLPNRDFLDCVGDIEQLADHLGIQRFSMLAYAGGCPYALAVAHKLPNRIERLALVSCMSPLTSFKDTEGMHPLNRLTIQIARKTPSVARQSIRLMLMAMNQAPEQYFKHVTKYLGSKDKQTIKQSDIVSTYTAAAQEAMHQGGASIADEIIRFVHPWGFDYTDIQAEAQMWHGGDDRHIPIRLAKRMAAAIPHSQANFYDKLGFYIYFDKWEEILNFLVTQPEK